MTHTISICFLKFYAVTTLAAPVTSRCANGVRTYGSF